MTETQEKKERKTRVRKQQDVIDNNITKQTGKYHCKQNNRYNDYKKTKRLSPFYIAGYLTYYIFIKNC